jgi:hypothetical protein
MRPQPPQRLQGDAFAAPAFPRHHILNRLDRARCAGDDLPAQLPILLAHRLQPQLHQQVCLAHPGLGDRPSSKQARLTLTQPIFKLVRCSGSNFSPMINSVLPPPISMTSRRPGIVATLCMPRPDKSAAPLPGR